MKTSVITTALAALSLSISFAGQHDDHDDDHFDRHDDHHEGHYESLAHQTDTKHALLKRLAIAPTHYSYRTNIHAIENAALSAGTVKMLGKVEYDYGESWLGHSAKHEIEEVILRSGSHCSPNALIVILGYADKTGRASVNYRLSETRADNVKSHINHISWEHNLRFRTASIAMGEEVELCEHNLGHNRVAEIWLIDFPPVVNQLIRVVEPVVKQTAVIATPAPTRVVTLEKTPQIVPSAPTVVVQPQAINPLQQLAEFLEHNVMLAPNADPNEFARQLSLLKGLGNNIVIRQ